MLKRMLLLIIGAPLLLVVAVEGRDFIKHFVASSQARVNEEIDTKKAQLVKIEKAADEVLAFHEKRVFKACALACVYHNLPEDKAPLAQQVRKYVHLLEDTRVFVARFKEPGVEPLLHSDLADRFKECLAARVKVLALETVIHDAIDTGKLDLAKAELVKYENKENEQYHFPDGKRHEFKARIEDKEVRIESEQLRTRFVGSVSSIDAKFPEGLDKLNEEIGKLTARLTHLINGAAAHLSKEQQNQATQELIYWKNAADFVKELPTTALQSPKHHIDAAQKLVDFFDKTRKPPHDARLIGLGRDLALQCAKSALPRNLKLDDKVLVSHGMTQDQPTPLEKVSFDIPGENKTRRLQADPEKQFNKDFKDNKYWTKYVDGLNRVNYVGPTKKSEAAYAYNQALKKLLPDGAKLTLPILERIRQEMKAQEHEATLNQDFTTEWNAFDRVMGIMKKWENVFGP